MSIGRSPDFAAGDEKPLDGRKVSLGRAVLLEDVTPPASAHLEIEVCPDFLDLVAELLDLLLVGALGSCRRATTTPLWDHHVGHTRSSRLSPSGPRAGRRCGGTFRRRDAGSSRPSSGQREKGPQGGMTVG